MIEVLFCKSTKIGSKIIRAVTGDDCSHCAIHFPDRRAILHAELAGGVQWTSYQEFWEDHQCVHKVSIPNLHLKPETVLGAAYDVPAFLYLGARYLLHKVGLPLPKKNIAQLSGAFLCTELLSREVLGTNDSLSTPHELFLQLSKMYPDKADTVPFAPNLENLWPTA